MNKTPRSNRFHIGIYGNTNVGKSSIVNAIFKREISIVSSESGTTTDPVYKNIEIDGLGPLTIIDTAGLDDFTSLGQIRIKKTYESLNEVDFAIYVMDKNSKLEDFREVEKVFKKNNMAYIVLVNKLDEISPEEKSFMEEELNREKIKYIFMSTVENKGQEELIGYLKENIDYKNHNLFTNIIDRKKHILLVVSIDSEYPDGRLILPQSQAIRDALGNNNFVSIVQDKELEEFLDEIGKVDLIVVDSKIFKDVKDKVGEIPMTSFSILMANHKGNMDSFLKGITTMEELKDEENVKILIYESCNHTANHEDIGRVKIPNLLRRYFTAPVEIDFAFSKDFSRFENYDLIIHCGACMETRTAVINKIKLCEEKGIPIINYGILLAYFAQILDRSVEVFKY